MGYCLSLFFIVLFLISFFKEKRSFKNAIFFMLALIALSMELYGGLGFIIVFGLSPLILVLIAILFIITGIISIKKEGLSLSHSLSIGFGLGIIFGMAAVIYMVLSFDPSPVLISTAIFIVMFFGYIVFTFSSLFLYSLLYRWIPKKRTCNFIIVHGAGLLRGNEVSPLLAGRLDKGIEVYNHYHQVPQIIVSGGQGSDETVTEAKAMHDYLISKGIEEEKIILEDKSKTTYENMQNSKKIIDSLTNEYYCIFVTSDYHVFRTSTYARDVKLKGDGVGSKTAFYYWPNAFIREYVAIIIHYKVVPVFLVIVWLIGCIVSFL
ncbi:MAG: ElyC/SanA/YdcF family protein [Thomasclavelia sp.]|nr:ElyC/SanA/YdcF family protein [Thomasclavelia sp.]